MTKQLRNLLRVAVVLAICITAGQGSHAHAQSTQLYDAALNSRPGSQGWFFAQKPIFGASARQSLSAGWLVLDTTPAIGDQAGYFARVPPIAVHPRLPVLDRTAGFAVTLTLQVLAESHASNHRTGFSLIVIASDGRAGIELAFWEDEIWVQADTPLFTHGEGCAFNTTGAPVNYRLVINQGRYLLFADGELILWGSLRNYASFGFPYNIRNFIFWGDDSGSGRAKVRVATLAHETNATQAGKGDLNGDLRLQLNDAVIGLQLMAGASLSRINPYWKASGTDIDGDSTIGWAEILDLLQRLAGLR